MRVAPVTDVSVVNIQAQEAELQSDTSSPTLKSYILRVLTFVSFAISVAVSYIVMYQKNKKMAAQTYFIYITPSPMFFKIWLVIYILVFLVLLHNMWKDIWRKKASLIFIASNILMIISTGIWQIRTTASIVVSGCILATVDNVLILFWRVLIDEHMQAQPQRQEQQLQNQTQNQINNTLNIKLQQKKKQFKRYSQIQIIIVRNIFSFFIGWVTVAGTVQLGLAQVYWWGFSLCLQFIIFWLTMPIAAMALFLFLSTRYKGQFKYCIGYILSVLWGFIGAAIASIDYITQNHYC